MVEHSISASALGRALVVPQGLFAVLDVYQCDNPWFEVPSTSLFKDANTWTAFALILRRLSRLPVQATDVRFSRLPHVAQFMLYADQELLVCPECTHERAPGEDGSANDRGGTVVKDAHGHVLENGDSVSFIKSLKVKGRSLVVKVGTKVKNIRLVEGDHNIDCKIDGIGALKLKSEFVKKA